MCHVSTSITGYNIAREEIRERIISLRLSPGSVIDEASLMDELGLGRTPIREALKLLEAENLVVIVPRRGIFVAEIGLNHLQQIHEMRLALEPMAARLAAQRITPARLAQLQLCSADMEGVSALDIPSIYRVDRAFHRILARSSGNELLVRDITQHYNLALRLWNLVQEWLQPDDLGLITHVQLIEAVAAHDSDRAEAVMREHIGRFHSRIRALL
jgi:DNA-binding GntR family transcriptional regulator